MDLLAAQPLGLWVGDWTGDVSGTVDAAITAGGADLRVLVVYNIPHRDCGSYSSGGAGSATEYADFIDEVAAGLAGRPVIIILEPDALPLVTCLSSGQLAEREAMMASAVKTLKAAGASVYLDAGDSAWISSAEMAVRLAAAGVADAAGFALNVSHTETTDDEIAYAEELRALLGTSAHYVVDTGRNGLGPDATHEWCNPLGRAVGMRPTLSTGVTGMDAALWVKPPGESDCDCNGGPSAGAWWAEYALGLAELGF